MAIPASKVPCHVFEIHPAKPEDVAQIAAIQVAAFRTNRLFEVQFPTDQVIAGYQVTLENKASREILDSNIHVLVALDSRSSSRKIAAFAKWRQPDHDGAYEIEVEAKPRPKGTNVDFIEKWAAIVNSVYEDSMGNKKCWRLEWLVTAKEYLNQGAASMLVNWGLEKAEQDHLPIALESTAESTAYYEKRGFKIISTMRTSLEPYKEGIYTEYGLLWEPQSATTQQ
jgi:GNAT superfamily N-acetyltransferase